eukprot:TRINITY_DN32477_c0_g6_i1.p1 TRINITY_DN32477_c0_g6~~TRINITY_DN32477_c0_g6_i1.p1  ORF type:complete len:157 (-),score=39.57 TRINITY_DN32477_c0_g6_i1:55-525(-)
MAGRIKGFGGFGLGRIAEQAHAQLGLLQRLLALAVQTDTTFVSTERRFQAQLAGFHLLHQLFQRFERLLELGDRGGVFGGLLDHATSVDGARARVNSPAARMPLQLCIACLQPGLQRCGNDHVGGRQQLLSVEQQGQLRASPGRQVLALQAVLQRG